MGTGIIFFKKPSDTEKCNNTTTEDIDSQYFEKVVEEIESGYKDKGLEAKALVLSEGNTTKADVLYLKLRAEAFQKKHITKLNLEAEKQKQLEKAMNVEAVRKSNEAFWNDFIHFTVASIIFTVIAAIGMGLSTYVHDDVWDVIGLSGGLAAAIFYFYYSQKYKS